MQRLSQLPLWGATYKVASASWTPGAYAGDVFVDANKTQFGIYDNTDDTLFLDALGTPAIGVKVKLTTSPSWVADAYAGLYFVDSTKTAYLINQNSASVLIVVVPPNVANPSTAAGWYIAAVPQGLSVAAPVSVLTVDTSTGWWQVITPAGAAVINSTSYASAANTVTPAQVGLLNVALADSQVVYSLPMGCDGITDLSINAGFQGGTSPTGTLNVQTNNTPRPTPLGVAVVQTGTVPGPAALDPDWTTVPTSLSGADATVDGQTMSGTMQQVLVQTPAKWLRLVYTADADSPGTGELSAIPYGTGTN